MEIKNIDKILEEQVWYQDLKLLEKLNILKDVKNAMKEYTEQFIDLAAETGQKAIIKSNYNAISEDILKLKELIK